jgi:hypothetical protein
MTKEVEDVTGHELAHRVIYALARPVVKMARLFGVPLKELANLVEMAYFHEMRAHGMTLRETSDALSVSQRKAVRLAKQLRENFIQPEVHHNLPRRIEFLLWSQPMSTARLNQVLPDVEAEHIDAAVNELLGEGRIEQVDGGKVERFAPVSSLRKLPRDTWLRRIGALNSFADNLTDATHGRFFGRDPRAFARTLSFKIPAGSHAELEQWYESSVLATVIAMNDTAEESETDQEAFQLSICWAPYEYIENQGDDQ